MRDEDRGRDKGRCYGREVCKIFLMWALLIEIN